jgi:NAD-dependent deacetylase
MLLSSSDAIPSSIELGPEWKETAKTIATAKKVAVLTGAGMSAESGIATFRAKEGGVWKQFNPSEVATPTAFKTNPHKVLAWHQSMRSICQRAEPNAGHYAITNLQALVPEVIVITQNIDGLHQRAGSKYVLEMHGHLFRMKGFCDADIHEQGTPVHCPVCRGCTRSRESWKPEYREAIVEFTEILPGEVPLCPHCSGALRPDIVWFNEGLDPYVLDAAWNIADGCDVLLVIGASLQVQPVSGIPWRAAYKGVKVIEINPEPAEVSGFWSARIQSSAAVALPLLLKMIEEEYR